MLHTPPNPIINRSAVWCENDLSYSNFTKAFRELAFSNFSVSLNTESSCTQSQERLTPNLFPSDICSASKQCLTRKTKIYYVIRPSRLRMKGGFLWAKAGWRRGADLVFWPMHSPCICLLNFIRLTQVLISEANIKYFLNISGNLNSVTCFNLYNRSARQLLLCQF